jgi:hypothetical protein
MNIILGRHFLRHFFDKKTHVFRAYSAQLTLKPTPACADIFTTAHIRIQKQRRHYLT